MFNNGEGLAHRNAVKLLYDFEGNALRLCFGNVAVV